MKRIVKYSFFLITLLVFSSCIDKLKQAVDNFSGSSNQPESISASNFSTISIDNLYKVSIPKYMKNMPSLHDEASLEYANIFKETYTIVIEEDKQSFIDGFKEFGEYDENLSPIENYLLIQKTNVSRGY